MKGYAGIILHVDLTSGSSRKEKLTEDLAQGFIGGKGLGARILYSEVPPRTSALDPKNILIFATGPLTGTLAPSSGRATVITKSPLTSIFLDSCFGGHMFGPSLKYAGYDLLVLRGASDRPVCLLIEDERVELCDASELWGLDTSRTYDEIRRKHGDVSVACIGLAGERLVKLANIISERHRAAGRGGAGAVMGSKKLKAVAVRGTGGVEVYDPVAFREVAMECHRKLWQHSVVGIRRERYEGSQSKYGTPVLVNIMNLHGILPTNNWRTGVFPAADNVSGETMRNEQVIKDRACFGCPIADKKINRVKKGRYAGLTIEGPEYESTDTLGPVCGVDELGAVTMADATCDELGLDTISTGVAIGFAMECRELGLLRDEDIGIPNFRFGNGDAVVQMVRQIANGKGLGSLLGEGVREASRKIGRGADKLAIHIKGLELPAYDPRGCVGHGLAYATSDRGGCHLRAWVVGDEVGVGGPPKFDRFQLSGKGEHTAKVQNTVAAVSSLVLCVNVGYALNENDYAKLLTAATGFEFDEKSFKKTGERIWNLTRLFNVREGLSRADDVLPYKVMNEPLPDGVPRGHFISRSSLDAMLDEYYGARGWDINGIPTPRKLAELELDKLPLS